MHAFASFRRGAIFTTIDIDEDSDRRSGDIDTEGTTIFPPTMYQTKPPSTSSFDPTISGGTTMPSPPLPLRPLLHRLNKTPGRTSKAASPLTSRPSSSLFARDGSPGKRQRSPSADNSASLQMNAAAPSDIALSSALTTLLNTPPSNNTLSGFDFAGCKVSIHVHIHPTARPAFPSPRSYLDRLKRKRSTSEDDEQAENGSQSPARQTKKVKLSHDSDNGFAIRGQGRVGRMPSRAEPGARSRARSKMSTRMSSRRADGMAGRLRG